MDTKFYLCEVCGNVVVKVVDSGLNPFCCGRKMDELKPNTDDGAMGEKHVPSCKIEDHKLHVKIGTEPHPNTKEHHIEWIYVQTEHGSMMKYLNPDEAPEACFKLSRDDCVERVYAYCNLHGLWVCDCIKKCADKCDK